MRKAANTKPVLRTLTPLQWQTEVSSLRGLLIGVAALVKRKTHTRLTIDELVSFGHSRLLYSLPRFNPSRGSLRKLVSSSVYRSMMTAVESDLLILKREKREAGEQINYKIARDRRTDLHPPRIDPFQVEKILEFLLRQPDFPGSRKQRNLLLLRELIYFRRSHNDVARTHHMARSSVSGILLRFLSWAQSPEIRKRVKDYLNSD